MIETRSPEGQRSAPARAALPCTLVFFGASGDLLHRMVMPAMFNLHLDGLLPDGVEIVGIARTPLDDDGFRESVRASLAKYSRREISAQAWTAFARRLRYLAGDYDDAEAYARLRRSLEEHERQTQAPSNRLFYLLTPPAIFAPIVRTLERSGLAPAQNAGGWTRIVVEKPFGSDLESARALQTDMLRVFEERDIYRIDHYLGKEPVQDIMALRFANGVFESLWDRRSVDCVLITAAESMGVGNRGGYYEKAGALRDMIQNHVFNLLALIAMEPPGAADAETIRDEKRKVLSALRPLGEGDVARFAVRGQYGAGVVEGATVAAYRDEPGVDPASTTDTYVALSIAIDNVRWSGVPFYVRSGKRLHAKATKVAVRFKALPNHLFGGNPLTQNVLVLDVQPNEGISFRFSAKVPGDNMHLRDASMDFAYGGVDEAATKPAYERLLLDALRGDATLFTRWDAIELAWDYLTPVLERWSEEPPVFPNYAAGSQGPASSDAMLASSGHSWYAV